MCEMCLNEPAWGPEIIDLLIFELFELFDFFLVLVSVLGLPVDSMGQQNVRAA